MYDGNQTLVQLLWMLFKDCAAGSHFTYSLPFLSFPVFTEDHNRQDRGSLVKDPVEEGNWRGLKHYFLSSLPQIIFSSAKQALDGVVLVTSNGS